MNDIYDFVIVGSGPCGMLSGLLLSEHGSTLLVEEGSEIKEEEANIYTYDQIMKGYLGAGINIAIGQVPLLLSEAKCLGGGSTLNSSLHHRAPNFIWEKWRKV